MLDKFKKFAMRGNVVDLAVGVIIGAAFRPIVTSVRCRKLLRYLPNSQTQRSPGRCLVLVSPSHGENRGSSPLGSVNCFNILAASKLWVAPPSPTFLQWTLPFEDRFEVTL